MECLRLEQPVVVLTGCVGLLGGVQHLVRVRVRVRLRVRVRMRVGGVGVGFGYGLG